MGIYQGEKEVVVAAVNILSPDNWITPDYWREYRSGTLYIHNFLIMKVIREKDTIITIMVGCILLERIFAIPGLLVAAFFVGVIGITSDKLTHWIHRAWFFLADMLGYVMSKVILGILFFVVLIPVALLSKMFRKDIMMIQRGYPSYFVEKHIVYEPKDLENPW